MKKTFLAAMSATCLVTFNPTPSQAMNCVAYVRSVTGLDLSGNAYQWWGSAAGVYSRGNRPEPGAVMVFARTRGMRDGHVAIVRMIRSSREILIDHANWVRGPHGGAISRSQSVIDVSPNNNWTQVRVEWERSGSYGRVNPVSGFIYQDGDTRGVVTSARYLTRKSIAAASPEPCVTIPASVRKTHGKSHDVSAPHHGQAHIISAALRLGDNRHHGGIVTATWRPTSVKHHGTQTVVARMGDNRHHGVMLASMRVGDDRHHMSSATTHIAAAVQKTAGHHNMVKLSHTVLLYHNKTAAKVMAEKDHPMRPVHIAAKIKLAVYDKHHAAKTKLASAHKPVHHTARVVAASMHKHASPTQTASVRTE